MKLGIVTPVLTLLPARTRHGRRPARIDESSTSCGSAERLGYHHCTCSEHVVIPDDVAEVRGGRYWDPLATFGYLAAVTTTIRFATHVLVLGYHHPLAIAKRYGTLDRVSNGRLILGVGVGSLQGGVRPARRRSPTAAHGPTTRTRGVRASLSLREPEYHGPFYDFEGMVVDPAVEGIYLGSRRELLWTLRAPRRARRGRAGAPAGAGPRSTSAPGSPARCTTCSRTASPRSHARRGAGVPRPTSTPTGCAPRERDPGQGARGADRPARRARACCATDDPSRPLGAPQPTYADLAALVAEARAVGHATSTLRRPGRRRRPVPDAAGRTRLPDRAGGHHQRPQARPGRDGQVEVAGSPGDGVDIGDPQPARRFGAAPTPGRGARAGRPRASGPSCAAAGWRTAATAARSCCTAGSRGRHDRADPGADRRRRRPGALRRCS